MLGSITSEVRETYGVAQRWKRERESFYRPAVFRAIELSDALRNQLAATLKVEIVVYELCKQLGIDAATLLQRASEKDDLAIAEAERVLSE